MSARILHKGLTMPLRTFLSATSLASVLLLSGCMTISPFEVTGAQITFFRPALDAQAGAQAPVPLSAAQRQFIEGWMAAHRAGWSSRYAATLTPAWCLRLDAPQDKAVSLCRYGATVVLRGVGPEMERALSPQDQEQFAREIESARG